MSTSTLPRTIPARIPASDRLGSALFIVAAVTFVAGGALHPGDSGRGSKIVQLHEMLVNPRWYPAHGLMLVAMASFAAAVLMLRRRAASGPGMARLLTVVSVVACVATVGMVFHLLAAIDAASLADGEPSFISRVQTVNETIVDATWGVAIAALALVGGLTRILGNRITVPLGVVGGLAFALASATIAFTDRFDPLFPLGSLIAVWAVAVAVPGFARRRRAGDTLPPRPSPLNG